MLGKPDGFWIEIQTDIMKRLQLFFQGRKRYFYYYINRVRAAPAINS